MCESAIVDPQEHSTEVLSSVAMRIYRSQRSSLGLVGIDDANEEFSYDIYKSISPDRDSVFNFLSERTWDRLIIHGRLATHGAVTEETAHPIEIDCDACDVDYILHNGIVYDHERIAEHCSENGHNIKTEVDSEVIAHKHGDVPESFDDAHNDLFGREPSWILMNDAKIFIHNGGRYNLSDRCIMRKPKRNFGIEMKNTNYQQIIMTPQEA